MFTRNVPSAHSWHSLDLLQQYQRIRRRTVTTGKVLSRGLFFLKHCLFQVPTVTLSSSFKPSERLIGYMLLILSSRLHVVFKLVVWPLRSERTPPSNSLPSPHLFSMSTLSCYLSSWRSFAVVRLATLSVTSLQFFKNGQ